MSVRAANYTLKVPNVFNSCLRDFEMRDFSKIAFRYFVMLLSRNQHVSVSVSVSVSVICLSKTTCPGLDDGQPGAGRELPH